MRYVSYQPSTAVPLKTQQLQSIVTSAVTLYLKQWSCSLNPSGVFFSICNRHLLTFFSSKEIVGLCHKSNFYSTSHLPPATPTTFIPPRPFIRLRKSKSRPCAEHNFNYFFPQSREIEKKLFWPNLSFRNLSERDEVVSSGHSMGWLLLLLLLLLSLLLLMLWKAEL